MPPDLSGWSELGILLLSLVYGFGSALFPLMNGEAFVVAAQATPETSGAPLAVALAVGQTAGKVTLFLLSRQGRRVVAFSHRKRKVRPPSELSRVRRRLGQLIAQLLNLVGSRRWGIPIVLLSALLGLPPIYAVAIIAGVSRISLWWFAPTVLVGRIGRFVLIAIGINASFSHLFHT